MNSKKLYEAQEAQEEQEFCMSPFFLFIFLFSGGLENWNRENNKKHNKHNNHHRSFLYIWTYHYMMKHFKCSFLFVQIYFEEVTT